MLDDLTPAQRQAVTHPGGPLLVLAGAGAGKTRVLCRRLAWLIDQGAAPSEVLALTFTRQAAEELRSRAEELLGRSHETLRVTTFHSWAHEVVRVHGVDHGLAPVVRQADPEMRKLVVLEHLPELDLRLWTGRRDPAQVVDALITQIDRCRDELVGADDYLAWARSAVADARSRADEREARRELEFAEAFVAHDRWLAEQGQEDFGMSLVRALHLLRRHDDRRDAVRAACRHVLVDEFQDTNHAQAELLFLAAHPEGSLVVVGDDDQGIYRFRGASTKNIADFRRRYPDAGEVRLEQNYRSTQAILDAAWSVVRHVPDRVDKRLVARDGARGPLPAVWVAPDPAGQARAVVAEIVRLAEAGTPYEEQAVLMRSVRNESGPVVAELERAGVPHQVRGGVGLLERREARDAIAWLRAVSDPADLQAHLRVLADPWLAVPWTVAADTVAAAPGGAPVTGRLVEAIAAADAPPRFAELVDSLGRVAAEGPVAAVRAVLDLTGIRARALAAGGAEGAARMATLSALERLVVELAADDPGRTTAEVAALLWRLAELDYRGDAGVPVERQGVQVMTVHQSKGLEFDVVFVIGMTLRNWPGSDRGRTDIPDQLLPEALPRGRDVHVAEARRLAYVAMTRARHTLVLARVERSEQGITQRGSVFVDDVVDALEQVEPAPVGAAPADGLLEAVGAARAALETATTDAARAVASGADPADVDAEVAVAARALVLARAAALAPAAVPVAPAPAMRVARPGVTCSVTGIARYRRCPLQYRLAHVDRVPARRDDPLRGVGNAAHAALEACFRPESPPPDGPALVARFTAELRKFRVLDTAQGRQALAQAEERFPALVDRTVRSRVRPVAVERGFTLMMGPHRVVGRIDRIDELPVGGYGLVDYKTGARPLGQADEDGRMVLRIYLAGAREAWRVEPRVATLEYVLDGGVTPENPDAGEMAMAMEQARDTLDAIAAQRFDPRPGWVCRSCDYQLLCPARDR